MRQGDPGRWFVVVLEGEVALSRVDGSGWRDLGSAGLGSIVGELSTLTDHPRQATVIASTDVRVAIGDERAFAILPAVRGVRDRLAGIVGRRLADAVAPVPTVLQDGTSVVLRPLLARDRDTVDHALALESSESLRLRFFSSGRPSGWMIDHLVDVDYINHFAWALTTVGGVGVGTGRYVRLQDQPETAELAFFVTEGFRGRGAATMLLGALGVAARNAGITSFTANVLYDNTAMRAVFDKVGARWAHAEPGVHTASFGVASTEGLLDEGLRQAVTVASHDVVTAAGLALVRDG